MNSKNIAKSLRKKIDDWLKNIDDEHIKTLIRKNAMITGGAIVSLLNSETPNDYDVYFKTKEAVFEIADYYAKKWNVAHSEVHNHVEIQDVDGRPQCFIRSEGIAAEDDENGIDDYTEPYATENEEEPTQENPEIKKPKYRPRYFSTNAISLSDKIQIVIRFFGPVEEIHKNYDFEHCKCSYDYAEDKVNLPVTALECIINKELIYNGSKYPLCSIIRTRKFISRGWKINAGQYVKMCLDLNELDLKDFKVFKDQLAGVDSAYFSAVIDYIIARKEEDDTFNPDKEYIFEVINRIF